jgi:hypothetical protein
MDTKATVKVGPFARGGKSRIATAAADHDFQPLATVAPVGIFLPATDELWLYGVSSKVTSDCLIDRLVQWWEQVRTRFAHITTLVINLDNGPENHSRRTQFMQRLVELVQHYGITVRLAVLSAVPSQVQSVITLLGHFGEPLSRRTPRLDRDGPPLCRHHDLERRPSGRRVGHHAVVRYRPLAQPKNESDGVKSRLVCWCATPSY